MFHIFWPIVALITTLVLVVILVSMKYLNRILGVRTTTLPDRDLRTYMPDDMPNDNGFVIVDNPELLGAVEMPEIQNQTNPSAQYQADQVQDEFLHEEQGQDPDYYLKQETQQKIHYEQGIPYHLDQSMSPEGRKQFEV